MVKLSLLIIGLALATGVAMCHYLDTPYLYESNATKQCAFIELPDGTRLSCTAYDPDQRYIHRWAK